MFKSKKIKIQEFAYSLSKAEKEITSSSQESFFHIIKLLIFNSPENYNHWRKEVWSNFHDVPLLKGKNRYPEANFIYKCIWRRNGDRIPDIIKYLKKSEAGLPLKDYDISHIESVLSKYFKWLSKKLEEDGLVASTEIYAELDKLGVPRKENN